MRNEEKIIGMISDLGNQVNRRFDALEAKVTGMNADIGDLKTDVASLKSDVAVLKSDVAVLKSDVAVLKSDNADLKGSQAAMTEGISHLYDRMDSLETYVREKVATKDDLAAHGFRITRLERLQGIA